MQHGMQSPQTSQPLFSVIVPVYKAQATLQRCVESILQQAPKELELILVEDGSPDDSGRLCDAIALTDQRVRVIHQKNAGASAARNAGLCIAQGQYIQFVDADDWLLPGLYQRSLHLLQTGIDLLFFGMENIGYQAEPPLPDALYSSFAELAQDFTHYLVDTGQFASPCNKIYRRSAIGPIQFDPTLPVNEDFLFNLLVFPRCKSVQFISTNYYACDHTTMGSLSRSLRTDLLDAELATRKALKDFALYYGLSPFQCDALQQARLGHVCVAQMSVLMSRKGSCSLRQYHRTFRRLLQCGGATALANWLAADPNRLMALPYRICIALRLAFPMAFWCWLRCSTTHSI